MTQSFHCRVVLPVAREKWTEVHATSVEEAVQEYHLGLHNDESARLILHPEDFPHLVAERTDMLFARIEVEGHGSFVSKLFSHGIYRRGGIRRRALGDPRQAVADAIQWTGTLDELTNTWDGEESLDEAIKRPRRMT